MISKIIKTASLEVVLGRARLCRGMILAHPRSGLVSDLGDGIWLGELNIRTLMQEGQRGLRFLAEIELQKAKHFGLGKVPHGKLRKPTDIDSLVEHENDFIYTFSRLARDIEAEVARNNEEWEKDSDLVRMGKEERTIRHLAGEREFSSGEELLKARLEGILSHFDKDQDRDAMVHEVFRAISNRKKLNDAHLKLVNITEQDIYDFMERVLAEGVNPAAIDDLRESLSKEAIKIMSKEKPGARTMGNLLIFMNYIDKGKVYRIAPDGTVYKPSRIDPWAPISPEEYARKNLDPVVKFVQKARNKDLLWSIYNEKYYPRFTFIGMGPDHPDMPEVHAHAEKSINALNNVACFDLVDERVSIIRETSTGHVRQHGLKHDIGPGIWTGLEWVRSAAEAPDEPFGADVIATIRPDLKPVARMVFYRMGTNLDAFAHFTIEEGVGHFYGYDPPHGVPALYADGTTNVMQVVYHDPHLGRAMRLKMRHMLGTGEEFLDNLIRKGRITEEMVAPFRDASNGSERLLDHSPRPAEPLSDIVSDQLIPEDETDSSDFRLYDPMPDTTPTIPTLKRALAMAHYDPQEDTGPNMVAMSNRRKLIEQQASDFITALQKHNTERIDLDKEALKLVFAIDEDLPISLQTALYREIERFSEKMAKINIESTPCKVRSYTKEKFGAHVLFYAGLGTSREDMPQNILSKNEAVFVLFPAKADKLAHALTTLENEFMRLFMLAQAVQDKELSFPQQPLTILNVFPGIPSLFAHDELKAELENMHEMAENAFRVAA